MQRYYVALAQKKLNPQADVENVFRELSDVTKNMTLASDDDRDFQFIRERGVASLDEKAFPYYLAGLGYSGMGDKTKAQSEFKKALEVSPDFLNAKIELDQIR